MKSVFVDLFNDVYIIVLENYTKGTKLKNIILRLKH